MTPASAPSMASAANGRAIEWLSGSAEPGIRMQVRRDLLDQDASDDQAHLLDGPTVRALLDGQRPDGGYGPSWYSKWKGTHWRLVSLVELGVPAHEPRALAAYETVLRALLSRSHRANVPRIEGRYRRCASQEGNALAVGVRLGQAGDPRVHALAMSLVAWQWPAGGWNCDRRPDVTHPSFYESITPLWGLAEYARATGDREAAAAARRAADFFLDHQVYQSHRTGRVGDPRWLGLHWPPYYGYTALWGLTVLARAGALPDPRADDALELVRSRRLEDGTWPSDGPWPWRSLPMRRPDRDVVDWRGGRASEMLTLNALRVLNQAGALGRP